MLILLIVVLILLFGGGGGYYYGGKYGKACSPPAPCVPRDGSGLAVVIVTTKADVGPGGDAGTMAQCD